MKNDTKQHEEEYIHISKRRFNGAMWMLLGISMIIFGIIIAVPVHQYPINLDWRLGLANKIVVFGSVIGGVFISLYGLIKSNEY